jgi:hypothetical protein
MSRQSQIQREVAEMAIAKLNHSCVRVRVRVCVCVCVVHRQEA